MATNTYVALDKKTTTGSVASVEFTGISSAYTDLVLVMDYSLSDANASVFMRFNSDANTNYSNTVMSSTGSLKYTDKDSNLSNGIRVSANRTAQGASTRQTNTIHIMNYSNTTTFKSIISRYSSVGGAESYVGLWRKTPEAINTITFRFGGATNFETGSTFSLYGISNAGDATPKATGGNVTSDATYWYHAFPMSGNFVPNQTLSCDYLVVAGGGAGGGQGGAGGGAGGFRTATAQSITAGTYQVLIGAGGVGNSTGLGTNGGNSSFNSMVSAGGGAASGVFGGPTPVANSGGSGGGGAYNYSVGAGNTPSVSPSQGNNGGGSTTTNNLGTGGGGGAGAVGGTGTPTNCGVGGTGTASSLSGTSVVYAGGGGGGGGFGATPAAGGTGGGGAGSTGPGTNGTTNLGGGGGGAGSGNGGNGGSGIVIVRYAK